MIDPNRAASYWRGTDADLDSSHWAVEPRTWVWQPPAEITYAILFSVSPWARYATGQNLVVDGGLMMD
ncbi:SDR family oxidoreductase [Arthrobacter sp. H14]|uniref:SDR family oxidoreductase n=1 Tax=Arthrobacter sp. H14 TaxID=1312959 RepID=UPI0012DDF44F|nr:SDR family oxidoreductase [Arthrobacter sp. H14]